MSAPNKQAVDAAYKRFHDTHKERDYKRWAALFREWTYATLRKLRTRA